MTPGRMADASARRAPEPIATLRSVHGLRPAVDRCTSACSSAPGRVGDVAAFWQLRSERAAVRPSFDCSEVGHRPDLRRASMQEAQLDCHPILGTISVAEPSEQRNRSH